MFTTYQSTVHIVIGSYKRFPSKLNNLIKLNPIWFFVYILNYFPFWTEIRPLINLSRMSTVWGEDTFIQICLFIVNIVNLKKKTTWYKINKLNQCHENNYYKNNMLGFSFG